MVLAWPEHLFQVGLAAPGCRGLLYPVCIQHMAKAKWACPRHMHQEWPLHHTTVLLCPKRRTGWGRGNGCRYVCTHLCMQVCACIHVCVYVHICWKTGSLSCSPGGSTLLKEPKCLLLWFSSHKMSQELCKACLTKCFQVSRISPGKMI